MADKQVKDKQLIPTAFGLADGKDISLRDLTTVVNNKLASKSMNLTLGVKNACQYLFDKSLAGQESFPMNQGTLTDQEYNIILKDFGEITGAAFMLAKHKDKYKAVKFPVGNEKLVDYILVTKNGAEEKFSAKAGQGGKPSITSVMPVIEKLIRGGQLDRKFQPASWVLYHLATEEKNGLYWGPLKAAEYLKTSGYVKLIELLKEKSLQTGYVNGLPAEQQLEKAVVNTGSYDAFVKISKKYYDAAGYTSMNVAVTQRIMDKSYAKKRYGLLHYPITAEIIKWLNTDSNHAKELLNMSASTLTVTQIYLDIKQKNLVYTVKGFSDATFQFGSPSSAPYPTNNRVGFTMIKAPKATTKV
jgi:hypothetical protein